MITAPGNGDDGYGAPVGGGEWEEDNGEVVRGEGKQMRL